MVSPRSASLSRSSNGRANRKRRTLQTSRSRRQPIAVQIQKKTPAEESARIAGLRYVSDAHPGLRRLVAGRGFRYVDAEGKPVRDAETLRRIRALVIPPAWTDVWICPLPNGHLQATGRDARGRKQHRYHPGWRAVRDETKYGSIIAFGHALSTIRARTAQHLRLPGLPRVKVLATVVRLLEATHIRVGNEEYARQNGSFGLTTMHDRHARIARGAVRFEFQGKSGIRHTIDLHDRRLAQTVKQCQDLPGHELFQYVDERGMRHTIDSADVNEYLRQITGQDFTAKDFRTWSGTVLATEALAAMPPFRSQTEAKRQINQAIDTVAGRLGNTRAVCRKCYIHPAVLTAHLGGTLQSILQKRKVYGRSRPRLSRHEAGVLHFLEKAAQAELAAPASCTAS